MPSDSFNLGSGGLLDLSAELLKEFGGVKGIAKKARDAYEESTDANKRQILAEVIKVFGNASEIKGAADAKKMSTEQLRAAALRLLKEHGNEPPWPERKAAEAA